MLKKINLQLFAEGDPDPAAINPPIPTGKTFSEDYVKTIREEAKENRIARKAAEDDAKAVKEKFKTFIGLNPEDELDDSKLTAYQQAQANKLNETMKKANDRLISAEIKGLDGYDPKLIERLLDRSKVTITDDGQVTGLKEAITALEAEFPAIKLAGQKQPGANPPGTGTAPTIEQEYADAYKAALANPRDSMLTQRLFAIKERLNDSRK